jgi:hypothetical protein
MAAPLFLFRTVPHTRVHAYGVTGQVVSATTQEPLADASVVAMNQPDHPAHCDKAGRFRLHPKRGWHAAYCIGPVSESLLPGWDVTYPSRSIRVSAPGYAAADFRVSAFARDGTNTVAGELAGAWLKATPLELLPLRSGPAKADDAEAMPAEHAKDAIRQHTVTSPSPRRRTSNFKLEVLRRGDGEMMAR